MKKSRIIIGILGGALFSLFQTLSVPTFAQDPMKDGVKVEEVEEVEIAEDSIMIVTPSDIALTPEEGAIPNVPDELVADRLGCLEKNIKLTYNSTIRSFIDYFTIRNRHYMVVMERRKNLYFPIFEEYLKKHNMPDELKYLSIVESGLNPRAISRAGAAGLWQFMPSTGKMYKLHQDQYIDERLDPYEATEAACKYLKELYNIFNDWELALASYNCGPGNVRKAIRQSGYKDSFWEIYKYLPQETRGYVPQFVAVVYSMNHLKDHKIVADSLEYPMQYETIPVTADMNLDKLCEQLNICSEDLQKLNPGLKKNIVPASLNYSLRIPSDRYEFFADNRLAILDSASKDIDKEITLVKTELAVRSNTTAGQRKMIHTVKRGESLGKIADKYHVSLTNLKKWNNMRSSTIRSGQKIVIYKKGAYVAPSNEPNLAKGRSGSKNLASRTSAKQKVYMVKPGDTLWSIAQKTNVSVDVIKKKNGLKGNDIKVGMKLILS